MGYEWRTPPYRYGVAVSNRSMFPRSVKCVRIYSRGFRYGFVRNGQRFLMESHSPSVACSSRPRVLSDDHLEGWLSLVESVRLEIGYGRKLIGGSNPSPSAIYER